MQDAIAILLLPAFGSLVAALFGRRLGRTGTAFVTVGAMFAAFVWACTVFFRLLALPPAQRSFDPVYWQWIQAGSFHLHFGLLLDPLSATFLLIVTGIGSLIHLYSVGYMHDDENFQRFFSYLNLFAFAMLVLVTADNFVFLLVGWGGVGLASYLLIGFWHTRPSAVQAARKAFVLNVAGDVGIMLAVFMLVATLGTVSYAHVFPAVGRLTPLEVEVIAFLLYFGAAAKSAQFPLHVWLPDAMEGPTPVSALIHAATMVTAGVYLVARAYPIFHAAPVAASWIAGIGAFTAIFAATIGLVQNDIKRVIAFSTVSQLGYMFMAVGVGAYAAGIFHLTMHAFFKALLFLGAGSVIHALSGEQDLRKMGGLKKYLPITYWTFFIGAAANAGIPLFSGFFSKDEILGTMLGTGHFWLWLVGAVTAFLTAAYIFRVFYLTFHGEYRGSGHPHESPRVMTVPLVILAVGALFGGYLNVPGAWSLFDNWLNPVFARYPGGLLPAAATAPNWGAMGVTAVLALLGAYTAYRYFAREKLAADIPSGLRPLHTVLMNRYYIDEIGHAVLVRTTDTLAAGLEIFDRVVIDGAVMGLATIVREWGEALSPLQSGYLRRYGLAVLLGSVVVVAYLTLWK